MKNASLVLSTLAFIGVLVLFGFYFSGKNDEHGSVKSKTDAGAVPATGRIAYVNIDSLEANYTYLKEKREELEKKQENMRAELQRSLRQMQNEYATIQANIQRKAKDGTLTQAEYESGQKRLAQMDQSLQTREASLTEQLLKEQEAFNKEIKKRLDDFLKEYNEEDKYDFIFSYGAGSNLMYTNPAYNITEDVIKGMNANYSKASDTTKKKK